MTSVDVYLWNDPGYTESGVERPPIGATLPSCDHYYTDLKPNVDAMFNKFTVSDDYVSLMSVTYLKAVYTFNESRSITIYGWVDSVGLKSDTTDYPMTDIVWHCDPWRTFGAEAEFKAGTVRRRPYNGS